VLEGSVGTADNQVRITAQFEDASTGDQIWAEHYDRPLKDIFSLQDEIVCKIVTTLNLQVNLTENRIRARNERIISKPMTTSRAGWSSSGIRRGKRVRKRSDLQESD
jgi:hypothetical protein